MPNFNHTLNSTYFQDKFKVLVAEADRLESEKIKRIQNLKNNLMETLAKMKSKEMSHMEKALAKIEQVEFEAEEVVNCDNENDLVSTTQY